MRSPRHTFPVTLIALSLAVAAAACGGAPAGTATPDAGSPTPDAGSSPETSPPPAQAGFTLALSTDKLPVLQGATASLEVTVTRDPGFSGAVTLSDTGLPQGASFAPVTIAEDEIKVTLVATAAADAPHSLPTAVTVRGTAGTMKVEKPLTVTVYGAPGTLDTSFAGGRVIVPMGASDDYAYALAVQPDGKLLAAGRTAEHRGDLAILRLERDGTPDATFGTGGKVVADVAGAADTAYAVAVQPDGKVVVAGSTTTTDTGLDFVVARFQADGALDATFGTGGKVTTAFGADSDTAYALLIQADGKIVVGGDSSRGSSTTGVDFALARYAADGTLDPTFGDPATPGKVLTAIAAYGGRDSIYALALQDVGGESRIVAAGGEGDFTLARYTAQGQLDVGFGTGGKVSHLFGSTIGAARAVKVAPDGKVIVAGGSQNDFGLVRLTAAGQLDTSFGGSAAGKVVTKVSATNRNEAQGLAIQDDGRIVLGGWAWEGVSSAGNFALARYMDDGLLDPTFGGTGTVLTPVAAGTKADQASAVLLQIDDRIPAVRVVAAGYASGSNYDFAITRYWR
jgi:uncharacterized delta-60 repeat protein